MRSITDYTADTMTINSKKSDFIINNGSIWDGDNFMIYIRELIHRGSGTKNYLMLQKMRD